MALRGDWYRPDWSQFQAVHIAFENSSKDNLSETLAKIEDTYKNLFTPKLMTIALSLWMRP